MKKAELVFIPAPAIGHLVSAVEFAKLLVDRDDRFSVTLLIMKLPAELPMLTDYFQPIVIIISCLLLLYLHGKPETACERCSEATPLDRVHSTCRPFLVSCSIFKPSMTIRLWILLSSVTRMLTCWYQVSPTQFLLEFCLLWWLTRRVHPLYSSTASRRFREMKGILANTFMELESHAINTIANGTTPFVYPVGPMLNLKLGDNHNHISFDLDHMMKWLDDQPRHLSYSYASAALEAFCVEQVKEIAHGLEHSGFRFFVEPSSASAKR
ncbi:UDP-glycosyltransferase 71K2 [Vitis vinifera]|uniref:UDP-glycosyltransferase 71K2 n=1 Tax=Vitis vinifera TaxID=29760 RepID=A0A438E4X5_VITVI|nr:UDP-glycosyltransferase 71K2 [Vitis vinifera]